MEAVSSGFNGAEGDEEALSWVEVKVPQKQPAGLLHVEVARGALLSHSKVSFLATIPAMADTGRCSLCMQTECALRPTMVAWRGHAESGIRSCYLAPVASLSAW